MRVPIRKGGEFTNLKPDPNITQKKYDELVTKLKVLKLRRPSLAKEVMIAAEGGDFSENAGYQAVKWQLRGLNQKIENLEEQIKFAVIIPLPKPDGTIQLGSRVEIKVDGKIKNYLILGSEELDLAQGIISYRSPLGASLMGRKIGEKFRVQLGEEERECEIIKVK